MTANFDNILAGERIRSLEVSNDCFVDHLATFRITQLDDVHLAWSKLNRGSQHFRRDQQGIGAAQPDHADPAAAVWCCRCDYCIGHQIYFITETPRHRERTFFPLSVSVPLWLILLQSDLQAPVAARADRFGVQIFVLLKRKMNDAPFG